MILSNDPSLTAWGVAVVDVDDSVVHAECIKTQKEAGKRNIRVGDDDCRRLRVINRKLLELASDYDVDFLLAERPHGSKNARAMKSIGFTYGQLTMMSETLDIPLEWFQERDCKKTLFGKVSVTKEAIRNHVREQLDVPWTDVKYRDEAIADALSIYLTAKKESPVLQMMVQ